MIWLQAKRETAKTFSKTFNIAPSKLPPKKFNLNFMLYIVDSQILCTHIVFPHILVFLIFGVITLDNHIII